MGASIVANDGFSLAKKVIHDYIPIYIYILDVLMCALTLHILRLSSPVHQQSSEYWRFFTTKYTRLL